VGGVFDAMGVIPEFTNVLCYDHWKSYLNYDCDHSLFNTHHLKELEQDKP